MRLCVVALPGPCPALLQPAAAVRAETERIVIHYDYYADVPGEAIDAFVQGCEMGRLVTVGAAGVAHIGLYPFLCAAEAIELHLHVADEQLDDLRSRPQCLFELDEVLGTIPSYWVDPEDAVMATAYHRTVVFECEAKVSLDPLLIVAQQQRLLERYQPEGGYRRLAADDERYRGATVASPRCACGSRGAGSSSSSRRTAAPRCAQGSWNACARALVRRTSVPLWHCSGRSTANAARDGAGPDQPRCS